VFLCVFSERANFLELNIIIAIVGIKLNNNKWFNIFIIINIIKEDPL